jgi:nicotinamidase-related amidase
MKAIYETDVQNDFSLKTGALFVHGFEPKSTYKSYGAEARLPNILQMHNYAKENGMLVLGSVDRHFYEDAELTRNEGGTFDDHCMNGTHGQLRVGGLERQIDIYIQSKEGPGLPVRILNAQEIADRVNICLEKNYHLIFEKQNYDVGTNPNFEPIMRGLIAKGHLDSIIINGFATDYCVKTAALKIAGIAEKAGYVIGKTFGLYVVTDAITAVNIDFSGKKDMEFGKKALDEMFARGVRPITTKEVLEGTLA